MEIRVNARLTGARLRDRILERWGSRQELESEASAGDAQAEEDLFTLDRLEEDPDRLEGMHERTIITVLEPEELARRTEKRLSLLDRLANEPQALNVSELARAIGRDKKNVSRDLELLETLGLVERIEAGREKLVRPSGSRISIELTPGDPVVA
jgi:DNA-binding transcriptional ArsR family regulator